MATLIIYLDSSKKNVQKITPCNQIQGSKERFDGNWQKLAEHITRGNYHKFEVI